MTYPYNSMPYGNANLPYANQEVYVVNSKQKKTQKAIIAGGIAGIAAGGIAGFVKNPLVSKSGIATDKFAEKVYDTFVKKGTNPLKETYEQGLDILKKIDKTKNKNELKELFNNNKEAAKNICDELKLSVDDFFKNITDSNLSNNKDIIKEKIKATNNLRYQNIKNDIQACWKQKGKTFEQASTVSKELFESIKEASKGLKAKAIAKYAIILGLVGTAVGFVSHKIINIAKEKKIQNQTAQQ